MLLAELNRVEKRLVGRLDPDPIVDGELHARAVERIADDVAGRELRDDRVDDDERVLHAEIGEVHADLARDADAVADARRRHFKCDFFIHWPWGPTPTANLR